MKTRFVFLILFPFLSLISCSKYDWSNPYDPGCPKIYFTPSVLSAVMDGNAVRISWTQRNEHISGFTLYRYSTEESFIEIGNLPKNTTQYYDQSVTAGKKYKYQLIAVAGNNKSDTATIEITTIFMAVVNTGEISELEGNRVKISGNIVNDGGGKVVSKGICWGSNPNPTVSDRKTTEGDGIESFISTLYDLTPGSTYYARAYGENERGISYGSEIKFTTLDLPGVITADISNITKTDAISGGIITSNGALQIIAKGLVWSTSPNPTIELNTKTNEGTGNGTFISKLSNLSENTRYYVRSYATNTLGTGYGDEKMFTTGLTTMQSLAQGLVVFYPFDGNANDESGNGNHGIINGPIPTSDRYNNNNAAYDFDGSNDWIVVNDNSSFISQQMSISVWVHQTEWKPGGVQFLVCGTSTDCAWAIGHNYSGRMGLLKNQFCGKFTNNQFSSLAALSKWVNYVIVFDESFASLYVNGIFKEKLISNPIDRQCLSNKLFIGLDIGGSPEYFKGKIDDIRIYNRILNQEEISYLANN